MPAKEAREIFLRKLTIGDCKCPVCEELQRKIQDSDESLPEYEKHLETIHHLSK